MSRSLADRRLSIVMVTVLVAATAGPALVSAQMMLPGANNGVAVGAPPREAGGVGAGGGAPIRPIVIKPPLQDTVIGHPLMRDGKSGVMTFDRAADGLVLTKLKLDGDKISKPQQSCSVDVTVDPPVVATAEGRPAGTLRFDVQLEACPFTIDVLDGAVLVSRADPSCDFAAADCRVTPGGLWGPAAIEISPSRATELERQRVRIETTMRTNFRALIRKVGKDRDAVKAIAREQAAFSSQREVTCREYDQESVHGFCSTQITQARALALLAKFGAGEDGNGNPRGVTNRRSTAGAAVANGPPPAGNGPPRLLPTIAPSAADGAKMPAKPAPQPEGAAKQSEGAAKQSEGAAKQSEGAAKQPEGAAKQPEGAPRQPEGAKPSAPALPSARPLSVQGSTAPSKSSRMAVPPPRDKGAE